MPPVSRPDRSAARLGRVSTHCRPCRRLPAAAAAAASAPSAGGSAPALKVYISVDIEGSVGIAHWDEAAKSHGDYAEFRDRMTQEAVAACEGVLAVDPAAEIWVKDAHGSGRNILQEQLPRACKLIRGWSGHPYAMVQELDGTFDACCFVGYHGHAAHPSNPLSHTNTGLWNRITLNDEDLSEYLQHAYAAALEGVPVVFVSGDVGVCDIARGTNPAVHTVATNSGVGNSVMALVHPQTAREEIQAGVQAALESDRTAHVLPRAERYTLRVRWVHHGNAYKYSFYPGASLEDSQTTVFESCSYWDVITFLTFIEAG